MAATVCEEQALANIARCEIEYVDSLETKTLRFTTASEGSYAPVVSNGQETILRVKNQLLATNKTEDIQYGSDITLNQVEFSPEILAIVDGGTVTKKEELTGAITKYASPVSGTVIDRKIFKLKLYVEQKDIAGATVQYACFTFSGCKGKPATFSFKDGEFMTPQYTIQSRVAKGESPYTIDYMEALPQ